MKIKAAWVLMAMLTCGYSLEEDKDKMSGAVMAGIILSSAFAWPMTIGEEIYKISNNPKE